MPLCNTPACKLGLHQSPGIPAVARQPCQPVPALCSLDCWRSWHRLLREGESLQHRQPAALAAWADLLGQGCSLCAHGSARHRAHLSQTRSPSLQLLWNKSWSAQCWVSGICPSAVTARVLPQAPLLKGRCSPAKLFWKVQAVCTLLRHEVIPVATVPYFFSAFSDFSSPSFRSSISRQRSDSD